MIAPASSSFAAGSNTLSLVKTPRSRGTFRISNLPNRNIPVSPKNRLGM